MQKRKTLQGNGNAKLKGKIVSTLSKITKTNQHQGAKKPLRKRVWSTVFEWAREELRADEESAHHMANAAVRDIEDLVPVSALRK